MNITQSVYYTSKYCILDSHPDYQVIHDGFCVGLVALTPVNDGEWSVGDTTMAWPSKALLDSSALAAVGVMLRLIDSKGEGEGGEDN